MTLRFSEAKDRSYRLSVFYHLFSTAESEPGSAVSVLLSFDVIFSSIVFSKVSANKLKNYYFCFISWIISSFA